MREFLQRHRAAIISFAALMLPLFLLYVHGRRSEKALLFVTAPAQSAASELIGGIRSLWDGYIALVDTKEDKDALEAELSVVRAEALRAKQLLSENVRLRKLLAFKRQRREDEMVSAHVIGREVSPFARVVRIRIDVGEEDGVKEGSPVVSGEGLVGRVQRIAGRYADVMLSVDARSSVSVTVLGKGVTGTVHGAGLENSYLARLLFLRRAKPLEKNDTLVTSGHDRVFPPGIEVGYIHSLDERQRGVHYELQVAPAVNFSTLEEVSVIVGVVEHPGSPGDDDPGAQAPGPAGGGTR